MNTKLGKISINWKYKQPKKTTGFILYVTGFKKINYNTPTMYIIQKIVKMCCTTEP